MWLDVGGCKERSDALWLVSPLYLLLIFQFFLRLYAHACHLHGARRRLIHAFPAL
jgi:hypothetical protein